MNKDSCTKMVRDGKDFLQIIQNVPEDKRFLLSMMIDAFVNGMETQKHMKE